MKKQKFKDINFRENFKDLESEKYFRMVRYLAGSGPDLKTEYINNEASNIIKHHAFRDFHVMLKKSGFKNFLPIKGIWLFNNTFREFQGIRQMADVDLLFSKDEFVKLPEFIEECSEFDLKSKGSLKLRSRFAEEISVVSKNVLIEMHSNITLVSFPGLIAEIFNNSEIENIDGVEVLNPPVEWALVIMLLHDYSRADFADLTVARLLEFFLVLRTADIEKLKNTASQFGLKRMLESHLYLIFTMLENTESLREHFTVSPLYGMIRKGSGSKAFSISDPQKFQKFIYGKRYWKLFLRNCAAGIFKKVGMNR